MTWLDEKSDIKMEIIKISKKLYDRQMVNSNEGNVSIRSGDKVFITPSQVCKDELTEDYDMCDRPGRQSVGRKHETLIRDRPAPSHL